MGLTDFLLSLAQWGGPGSCDFDGDWTHVETFTDGELDVPNGMASGPGGLLYV